MRNRLLEIVSENLEPLLQYLNLNVNYNGYIYSGKCFHNGDNPHSLYIYKYQDVYLWKCWTKHCEEEWGKNLVGLVRGSIECSVPKAIFILKKIYKLSKEDLMERIVDQEKKYLSILVRKLVSMAIRYYPRKKN